MTKYSRQPRREPAGLAEVTLAAPDAGGASGAVIVKPVVNAIRILRHLSAARAPERVIDLARQLSINPSTCFNILRTLVSEDVVQFESATKLYSVAAGNPLLPGQDTLAQERSQLVVQPLREVASELQVTLALWRRLGTDKLVLVNIQSGAGVVGIHMPVGQRLPLLMGASGRLFAGRLGLPEQALRSQFDAIQWARKLTFETYMRQVRRAQRTGWAVDEGYFAAGMLAVAVPVENSYGDVPYTITAIMVRGSANEGRVEVIGPALKELAHDVADILF